MNLKDVNFGVAPKIIRNAGQLNSVVSDGRTFRRVETISLKGIGRVKCAPYDNHFVFYDARHLGWTTFCTCGSPAVVVSPDAYKHLGSNQGQLLICLIHTQTNRHADGAS